MKVLLFLRIIMQSGIRDTDDDGWKVENIHYTFSERYMTDCGSRACCIM